MDISHEIKWKIKMEKGTLLFQIFKIFLRFCVYDKMVSVTGKYFRLIKHSKEWRKEVLSYCHLYIVNFAFTATR